MAAKPYIAPAIDETISEILDLVGEGAVIEVASGIRNETHVVRV